jgi:hypothetical protein
MYSNSPFPWRNRRFSFDVRGIAIDQQTLAFSVSSPPPSPNPTLPAPTVPEVPYNPYPLNPNYPNPEPGPWLPPRNPFPPTSPTPFPGQGGFPPEAFVPLPEEIPPIVPPPRGYPGGPPASGGVRGGGGFLGGAAIAVGIALEPMQSPLAVPVACAIYEQNIGRMMDQREWIKQSLARLKALMDSLNLSCPMAADCLANLQEILRRLFGAMQQMQDWIDQLNRDIMILREQQQSCMNGGMLPGVEVRPPGVRNGVYWAAGREHDGERLGASGSRL